jgi:hypothetical protein
MGINGKLVAFCTMSIQNSQYCMSIVLVENEISKIFKFDSGLRQGDVYLPHIFQPGFEAAHQQQ